MFGPQLQVARRTYIVIDLSSASELHGRDTYGLNLSEGHAVIEVSICY